MEVRTQSVMKQGPLMPKNMTIFSKKFPFVELLINLAAAGHHKESNFQTLSNYGPPLHPTGVHLQPFFLDGNHASLNLVLLRTIDRTWQHLVTLLHKDIIDLAMLATYVIGQQILGLEGETAEETLEALHQIGVELLGLLSVKNIQVLLLLHQVSVLVNQIFGSLL